MREREKKIVLASVRQTVGKAALDMSAEERFYARSREIRMAIANWLADHIGETWPTRTEMDVEAAQAAKCSSITAHRWINQYVSKTEPFQITEMRGEGYTTVLALSARLGWRKEDRV